jgi:hypothetical protein
MKTRPLPVRRKFADARDQIEYLRQKLLYWLYEREDASRARIYAERLARLLSRSSPGHEAILPEECWSLICESRGNMAGAIEHRENEIRLMRRLHELARTSPKRDDILRLHGYDDLCDRLELLAVLCYDDGQLDRAIEALQESKKLCKQRGVAFHGQDLHEEYLAEKSIGHKNGRIRT